MLLQLVQSIVGGGGTVGEGGVVVVLGVKNINMTGPGFLGIDGTDADEIVVGFRIDDLDPSEYFGLLDVAHLTPLRSLNERLQHMTWTGDQEDGPERVLTPPLVLPYLRRCEVSLVESDAATLGDPLSFSSADELIGTVVASDLAPGEHVANLKGADGEYNLRLHVVKPGAEVPGFIRQILRTLTGESTPEDPGDGGPLSLVIQALDTVGSLVGGSSSALTTADTAAGTREAPLAGVVSICGYDGTLWAADSDNRLWGRAPGTAWAQVGHANGVRALAATAASLFAITADGQLWTRTTSQTDESWTAIGSALGAVALAATPTSLWAATEENALLTADISVRPIQWDASGHANGVTALTAVGNELICLTNDGVLWRRPASAGDVVWTQSGKAAAGSVGIAEVDGAIQAIDATGTLSPT